MPRTYSRLTFALLASTTLSGLSAASAAELPTGGTVAHGAVGITNPGANALAIQQSSSSAIVNWQGFSIGQGARVDISQPSASSTLLNRVTGSTPSSIAGQLNANGQVYLVNPNGIAITPSGQVKAGGFVGSTLGIADEDFKAGRRTFSGNGNSAAVVNQGTITIGAGGYAALLGGSVDNSGTISVPLGKAGLGAGERATLDLTGDGFLQVAVPSAPNGSDRALIQHSGRITARGGRVEISAATARETARQTINLSGVVEARSVGGRSGAIVLGGGAGGQVAVSGKLDASARQRTARAATSTRRSTSTATGGDITVTGNDILLSGAAIDASGPAGGGTIRIGGDLQGGGSLPRAATTRADAATTITADATRSGKGGSVVVWSDEKTSFAGSLSARGGPDGGDGGFAEVSGKSVLSYTGMTDLRAPQGRTGTLLLDPNNVVISDGATTNESFGGGTFTPTVGADTIGGSNSVINATQLSTALNTANIVVTTQSSGNQPGDITVLAPVSWNAATLLSLIANRNIAINAAITSPTGGLSLTAGGVESPGTITATGAVAIGTFTLARGNWVQNGTALPAFAATDFNIGGGSFLRAAGGTGAAGSPYLITDVYGLQGIGSSSAFVSSSYALANDIDARGTAAWNAGSGFVPIASTGSGFSGSLDGRSLTVTGLTINRPQTANVGLFSRLDFGGSSATAGTVTNLRLANAAVRGSGNVGAVVGNQVNGTISGTFVTGSVQATTGDAGGLAGAASGTIRNSGSDALVAGGGNAGGLVGTLTGNAVVADTFATGAVSGGSSSGGLVGRISGTDATAGTPGNDSIPGSGSPGTPASTPSVTTSYATGRVTGGSPGGLVGATSGPSAVTASYWDTQTTGQAASRAGTPQTTAQLQSALPPGFSPTTWGIIPGQSYPYLRARFPNGPLVVSGILRGATETSAPQAGGQVGLAAGRSLRYATTSGANGYYYFATDPLTGPAPQGVTTFAGAAGTGSPVGSATIDAPTGTAAITSLDILAGTSRVRTAQSTASGLAALLLNTGDSSVVPGIPYTVAAAGPITFRSAALVVESTNPGGFTIDRSIVNEGSPAAAGGTPSFVTLRGAAANSYAGPVTIAPGQTLQSRTSDVTVATTRFTNNAGPTGIQAGGVIRVFSTNPANDTRGGLTGTDFFNTTFPTTPGGGGNQFIFTSDPPAVSPPPPDPTPTPIPAPLFSNLDLALAQPTLSRQLPKIFLPIDAPLDTLDLGLGGGGPTLGTGQTPGIGSATGNLAFLQSASAELDRQIAACERRGLNREAYTDCVGGALDQFANKIDTRILELPAPLRNVTAAIREAARTVRAAPTIAAARAAVRVAVTEVRKAIALIRADEPALARVQVRQGNVIASALQAVDNRLARAVGL